MYRVHREEGDTYPQTRDSVDCSPRTSSENTPQTLAPDSLVAARTRSLPPKIYHNDRDGILFINNNSFIGLTFWPLVFVLSLLSVRGCHADANRTRSDNGYYDDSGPNWAPKVSQLTSGSLPSETKFRALHPSDPIHEKAPVALLRRTALITPATS